MIKIQHTTAIEHRSLAQFETDTKAFQLTHSFSQANIKLEQYGYAIADAAKAIELDSKYVKVQPFVPRYNHTI